MEDSQRLINKIQKKDKISRYMLFGLLIMNIVVLWWAVTYMLNRVDKFERTIDCKLLIIPEDRTKTKFIKCGELNDKSFSEIIDGKEKPSFKEVNDEDKSQDSSIVVPSTIEPLPNIIVNEPNQPTNPSQPTPIRDTLDEVTRTKETIIDPINGELQRREEDTIWRFVEP